MAADKKKAPAKRTLPDGTPEYAVTREVLMTFFRPPVSESTFYKLPSEFLDDLSG